jgi:hypothetical protein
MTSQNDSDLDETTVITRVGMPKVPDEYKDTYFEQMVKAMAVFVEEVRGYRADLLAREKSDENNWQIVKNEVAGVRSDFVTFKLELEQWQRGVTEQVETATRTSESKIRVLEGKFEELSAKYTLLEQRFDALDQNRRTPLPAQAHVANGKAKP